MARAVLAGAALACGMLALAGCASPPPAGHTAAELQAWTTEQQQLQWSATYPETPVPYPNTTVEHYLGRSDATDVWQCMSDQGIEISFDATSASWTGTGEGGKDPAAIAEYLCNARFPVYPLQVGFITDAQHAYLYDYYQAILVPCLAMRGFAPSEEAPTRSEFNNKSSVDWSWSPYAFITVPEDSYTPSELEGQCPSTPFQPPSAD